MHRLNLAVLEKSILVEFFTHGLSSNLDLDLSSIWWFHTKHSK
uniref:Uncharacterized protein n=1 Tax=Nelumbo nucifera TaxID=4432 RepID=A0A822XGR8_NELNU|nr:TPA_asm: hypothetical protein HUJ06_020595 [Nelumbo nucifera]